MGIAANPFGIGDYVDWAGEEGRYRTKIEEGETAHRERHMRRLEDSTLLTMNSTGAGCVSRA